MDWNQADAAYARLESNPYPRDKQSWNRLRIMRKRGTHAYIEWDIQPLGQVADTILALRLGCTRHAVANARRIRNVPRYQGFSSVRDSSVKEAISLLLSVEQLLKSGNVKQGLMV